MDMSKKNIFRIAAILVSAHLMFFIGRICLYKYITVTLPFLGLVVNWRNQS